MMYDTIGLGSTEAVLRDMVMSADEEYFYVPTQSKVQCLTLNVWGPSYLGLTKSTS